MHPFHLYHVTFFLIVSGLLFVKQFTITGLFYALFIFIIFIIIWRFIPIKVLSELPLKVYSVYVMIQLLLCMILILLNNVHMAGVLGVVLLLNYAWFSYMIIQRLQTELKFSSIIDEIQRFDATFLSVRTERHDYVRHIHVLHHFLEEEQFIKAKKYLRTLVDDYEDVNQSIKREQGHIASVLYQCRLRAPHAHIEVNYQLEQPLSRLPLEVIDQVNLLTNLLNNAVDAAEQSRVTKKEINLVTSIYGGFYKLDIQNTSDRPPDHILDHLFERFGETTKGDQHEGLGTYIIAEIIKRYDGKIDHIYDDNQMTIRIHLPLLEELSSFE